MFEITSKRKKLTILGVLAFFITFFLVLFSSGFFERSLPRRCVGEECGAASVKVMGVEKLAIENSSISPEEIIIKKGEGKSFEIVNNDNKIHRILKLCKVKGEEDYKVLEKIFVESNESKRIDGFMNPENKKNTISAIFLQNVGIMVYFPDVTQCIISCTSCSGENSQVRVILED